MRNLNALVYSKFPHHKVICIDMKSLCLYTSVEAVNCGFDPLTTFLVIIGDKT